MSVLKLYIVSLFAVTYLVHVNYVGTLCATDTQNY